MNREYRGYSRDRLTFPNVESHAEPRRVVPYGKGYGKHIRDGVVEAEEGKDADRAPDT